MSLWQWWHKRTRREDELDEEIQAHLRMAERDRTERGETTVVRPLTRPAPTYGASLETYCSPRK